MTPEQALKVAHWLGKRDYKELVVIIGMAQQRLYMLEGNIKKAKKQQGTPKQQQGTKQQETIIKDFNKVI